LKVEAVKAMFPHIHTAAIQADLALTGSVEATADKILRLGNLPMVIIPDLLLLVF
jgi:coupling of ubiquitin conjugation to ER degradation protein 1